MSFVVSAAARAQPAPLRATFGVSKRLALILTWIAAALLASLAAPSLAAAGVPVVTSVTPNSGPNATDTTVTITGTGFTGATTVNFNLNGEFGRSATFQVLNDTTITATAPGVFNNATADVQVTTAAGTSAVTAADQYSYVATPPMLTSISPAFGPGSGNNIVQIFGSHLSGVTGVKFGSVSATSVNVAGDTQVSVRAPAGSGVVDITLINNDGTSTIVPADRYTYAAGPAIYTVVPASGPPGGGTTVQIGGAGFDGTTSVKFGSTPAASFFTGDDNDLSAVSPPGAGTVDIIVTNAGGQSLITSTDQFTYATTAPVVSSVSPSSGSTAGGGTLTVTGTNLTGATAVKFGFAPAPLFTVVSATQITATIPAQSAGTVDVTVVNAAGTSATLAADQYTYVATPTVTGVSPTSGPAAGGAAVTINGTNFSGVTSVKFGSAAATNIVTVSSSQLTVTSPAGTAGSATDVTVTTSAGTSATSAADQYTFSGLPVVSSISPTAASPAGGGQLTILGSNFVNVTSVTIGGKAVSSFIVESPTEISTSPPSNSAGVKADVIVTTSAGASAANGGDVLSYVGAPKITSFTPASGPAGGGTSVTITGSSFTGATAVVFNVGNATSYTVNSDTQITAIAPSEAVAGGTPVAIEVAGPGGSATSTNTFAYLPAPAPTTVSPFTGPTAGGTSVTISGSHFTGATAVKFGGANAARFTVNSDTSISATTPAGAAGPTDVSVTGPNGTGDAQNAFDYIAPPAITSVAPTSGLPQAQIQINGSSFQGSTAVMFGTIPAQNFTVSTGNLIIATTPFGGSGTVDITITNASGTSPVTAADHFTFITTPVVAGVSPGDGPASGGTAVDIGGINFTGATAVKFGTKSATSFTVNGVGDITAVAPSGSGTVDVTVTTPQGTSATSASDQFVYDAVPTVSGVSPNTGPAGGNTSVTITGAGFTGITSVSFGPNLAAFTVVSPTQITAVSPPGSGAVDVTVANAAGVSAKVTADKYTYQAATAPVVSAITPTSGPTAGSTMVTITGSGFASATTVKFGGVAVTNGTINSDNQITVLSPAGSAGVVDVTVTNPVGTSATSAADKFTYTNVGLVPQVTGISPAIGPTAGGNQVVITGSIFTGATGVFMGTGTTFTVNSDTQITATAPPGGGTVFPTVSNVNGSSPEGAVQYTFANVPVIASITPATGSTAGGTTVTINGTGLGSAAIKFGATAATSITEISDNQLIVTSPAESAGAVDITATNQAGTSATSSADQFTFSATAGAPTVSAISPGGGPTSGGTTVTLTGQGFTGATGVKFGTAAASSFTVVNDGQVTAVSPAGAGTVDVTVTNAHGTSATGATDKFIYGTVPTVTHISPNTGPSAGGTSVTVTGTAFTGVTAVSFSGVNAASFTVNSATSITAVSPVSTSGTADIQATTPIGTSATSSADQFTYTGSTPPPTVTAVSPNSGSTDGGTTVTITGTNFVAVGAVWFGSANATIVSVGPTSITVHSPSNAAGAVDVTVQTLLSGTSATSAADHFTYVAAPTPPAVAGVSPSFGPTAGGASVTITGSNFTGATAVKFGANAATSFVVNSATSITAVSPAGVAGAVDITVTTPQGVSPTNSADIFAYNGSIQAPTVTSVSPNGGPTLGGAGVTISGTNFAGATQVLFGSTPASSFAVNGSTSISALSPAGSAGTVDITVVTSAGTSATSANDQFTFTAPPTVTAVSPTSGSTSGGTTITITGTNFTGAFAVKFGGNVNPASFTVNSATSITAVTAATPAGTYDITVQTANGGISATSTADRFTFGSPPPAPVVSAISPTTGPTAGGTSVTITGSNLTGATSVLFGSVAATSFTVNSATQVTAVAPAGSAGVVDVTVATASGTSATSTVDRFTYAAGSAPVVSALSPTSGTTAGETSVTITGSGFTGASAVKFGATAASSFTVVSDTQITGISPVGAAGVVDVTVTTAAGTSAQSAADQFTYVGALITQISPTGGAGVGGTSVTITGSGFTGATSVKFGTKAATTFTVNSDTQVTATSPSGTGTVDISITTPGGTTASVAADKFTYGAIPAVTRVSPTSGPSSGGTTVTVTGSGFTGATAVTFGGTAATGVSVTNATTLTAVSPAGSGTVDIQVTTPVGTSVARTLDHFTYTGAAPAPAVTAISPTSGSTAGGASVTITGSNFTGATGVKFGAASATFTVNGTTSITATSPAGSAGTVDVTVTTSAGTSATSAADTFTFVAPSPPTVTSISPTTGPTTGGTSVSVIGTNFTGATAVMFGSVSATFTVNSATSITATSPPNGAVEDVVVVTPAGSSPTSVADRFTYVAPPQPAVTSINPNTGPAAGGTSVTIVGTAFTGATAVRFGSIAAASFTVNSDTQITATSPAGASGVVDVTVGTAAGFSAPSTADDFTYAATSPPTVTSLAPPQGPKAGGTSVNIVGSNFIGVTSVTFGGVAATFTVLANNQITATSPPGSAGAASVIVTTTAGASSATAAAQFTYFDPSVVATVSGVSPSSGGAGQAVTISGSNFFTATGVTAGGQSATNLSVVNNSTITANMPFLSAGVYDVIVNNAVGSSPTTASDRFTVIGTPIITGVSPATGPTAGGTTVTITGTALSTVSSVRFGGIAAASFKVNSDTSITASSPAETVGTVDVSVVNAVSISPTSASDHFTFTAPAPVVASISPTSGAAAGGATVTITGSALTGATGVKFGTIAATSFTVVSDSQVTAVSPAGSGAVDVSISTPAGTSAMSAADLFTYTGTSQPPVVTGLSPTSGTLAGGTSITVTGRGFTGATAVSFGGGPSAQFTVVSDTQITTVSPPGAGTHEETDITVTTPVGTSATSLADQFTWIAPPSITSISPTSGTAGAFVLINGAGFTGATSVTFGGVAASFSVTNDGQIGATAPAGTGVVDVRVTTAYGTSLTGAVDQFTYPASGAPVITQISPTGGATVGGTSVTITGSGFTGATAVKFGTKAATAFTVNSDTQVTATSPSGTGAVDITITTSAGTSATVAADKFTYGAVPAVTRVSPTSGPSTGGTTVTVTGSGFTGATAVT
ncbi:MAG TPA: IPT/TIG domain-containing protein, partial [Caulobacteraceae bacterium]